MEKAKKKELIKDFKKLRKEKGLTYQDIADKTEENGEAVSLSTIKLIFSDRDTHDHDYNKVLKPIANVLLPFDEDDTEAQTVLTMLDYKNIVIEQQNRIIEQLKNRLDKKESNHKEREGFLKEQVTFYKEQIKFKDSQIKRLNEAIDRKDAVIRQKLIDDPTD